MGKTKKTSTSKKNEKKLKKAETDFSKMSAKIGPFIPRVKTQETSTEGKWQTSTGLSLY